MPTQYLLGIDIGTSGARALLCDTKGKLKATASDAYTLYHPKPLWSEQKPADWWKATCVAVKAALAKGKVKPAQVIGVGLSGQMHGSVFLDEAGEVIRPTILWNDGRTAAECRQITRTFSYECLIKLTCNPSMPGFTAPKILWLKAHEPDNWKRVRQILLPKDYIRYRLTGGFATEVSDASGTLLFDVRSRRWSTEVLDGLGINADFMPQCFESPEIAGALSESGAKATGLAPGTPVVGGGGDQAAGAVGAGVVRPGVVSATMGTSGVVFAHSEHPQFDPDGRLHTFCHAVPGKWHVMGVALCAGGSFQWFRNEMAQAEVAQAEARKKPVDPYDLLTRQAAKAPAGCEGLVFLPYLTGERTPHNDPYARGGWIGLTSRHTRAHLIRAVMEGATFAMNNSLDLIRDLGVKVGEVRLLGGGARSAFWRKMQANIYHTPVCTINAEEGPAYGAALLAGVGAGVWNTVPAACKAAIRTTGKTAVDLKTASAYGKLYRNVYRNLYKALKPAFGEMARFAGAGEGAEGG